MSAPTPTDTWLCVWITDGYDEQLHLIPEDDLVGHEQSDECACGPYVEHLGEADWLVSHHALDGRK